MGHCTSIEQPVRVNDICLSILTCDLSGVPNTWRLWAFSVLQHCQKLRARFDYPRAEPFHLLTAGYGGE
jgi:hypothetical protein